MRDYAEVRRLLLRDLEPHLNANPFMTSDMSGEQVSALALADSFFKKLCPTGNSVSADDAALKKFMRINSSISTDPFDYPVHLESDSVFWDYFKNNFQAALGFEVEGTNYDLDFIRETMVTGPGTAQKAVNTDFMSKLFEGPVSYTSEFLIPLYRSAIADTGLWAEAEAYRFKRFPFVKVEGGKIFFAKKNAEISRTCCTPANLSLLFQMSVGAFIEMRLEKYFGISLSTQPDKNRELARKGSIDGSFGTIDLVSASDSISWQLCLAILERSGLLTHIIKLSRDEVAVLPNGDQVVLNMVSTMGNGFTFPLQTLIFACAVKSVYEMMNLKPTASALYHPSCQQYGVFGDDIVVCREAYGYVVKVLTNLGFEVNDAKSFNNGYFRESCGSDYFAGRNVRGVYIQSLETPQHVYSAINRLHRWGTTSGIALPSVIGYLRGLVRPVLVPPSESDDSGIKVPFIATQPKVNARYWFKYRYYKRVAKTIAVPQEGGADGVTPSTSRPDYQSSVTFDRPYANGTKADDNAFGTYLHRRRSKRGTPPSQEGEIVVGTKALLNPLGIGVGFLGGYIRRPDLSLTDDNIDDFLMGKVNMTSTFSRRDRIGAPIRYRLASGEIPYWDYLGLDDPFNCSSYEQRVEVHKRWSSFVMASLCVSSG